MGLQGPGPGGSSPPARRYTALRDTKRLVAGTNTGRVECYDTLLGMGFRSWMNGIAMLKPAMGAAIDGYNLPGVFAVEDWR